MVETVFVEQNARENLYIRPKCGSLLDELLNHVLKYAVRRRTVYDCEVGDMWGERCEGREELNVGVYAINQLRKM